MPREDFVFCHRLRVRWAEADMQGVVFNGHYMTYCDVAITEYWRALFGGDPAGLRAVFDRFFVVRASLDYHAPARFDDEIEVCARTSGIGNSSLRVLFEIHRGTEHLVSGENVYVYAEQGASLRIPEPMRAAIRNFERVAPQ